ncbi:PhoD-like phosphatase N-terminal domain-containing protein, partial [Mesorhizobium sp.]
MNKLSLTRRAFVTSASAFGLVGASGLALPYYSRANQRPAFTHGVQSGDIDATSGMVWTRTGRPARVMYEVSTTESFVDAVRLAPLDTSPA